MRVSELLRRRGKHPDCDHADPAPPRRLPEGVLLNLEAHVKLSGSTSSLHTEMRASTQPSQTTVAADALDTPGVSSSTWKQLRLLLRGRRRAIAALAVASIISGFTESGILAVLAQAATALVARATRVHVSLGPVTVNQTLGVVLAFGFVLALIRLSLQGVIAVVPARIASDMQARVRSEVFAAFTGASWAEQSRDREGHLQELVTNQATQAGTSAGQAGALVVVALTFVVLVISALLLNVVAALAVLVTSSALFALLRPVSNLGTRRARALSSAFITYAGGVNEAVRLAEETQVFGAAAAQRDRNDASIVDVRTSWFHAAILITLVPGVYQSLIFLLMVTALAGLYALGTAPLASLGAVVLLLVRAGNYGQQAQSTFQSLGQSLPYLERLQGARRRYAASTPPPEGQDLKQVRSVAFDAVNFEYEHGRPVLVDIRFEVRAGETIGIVGPSGAGKSTAAEILLGLRAPTSGQYLVNGTPAGRFRREDWHRRFSYLPQEPRLLHASVAENIRFFRAIDDAAVEHAARLAGIHDEVVKWSRGYDTVIGPRADAISGGQQQRICLARALAARPEVLVLDEPTSALDPHAESLIKESLATLKGELTLFVVAHRLSTLDVCDRVMVIVAGRLEAFDIISELQASSGYFRSAWAVARSATAALPMESSVSEPNHGAGSGRDW